jgi:mono/diheme cytochrome c family protein
MKAFPTILITAGVVAVSVFVLSALSNRAGGGEIAAKPVMSDRIERGRYLAHQVGLCIDCHSPRNEKGEFIESKHLTGSAVPFLPSVPMPWAPAAPKLVGLPAGFTEKDMVHFLMTGERPNGRPAPLPPMPPYRMNHDDAQAGAAYLRSLPADAN